MKLEVTSHTSIRDIQEQLNAVYPFLMVKFSTKAHHKDQRVRHAHWYADSFRLTSIAKKGIPGSIIIEPWHKTGEVEQEFESRFGLHAQIFRREGDKWIETAGTDIFSLFEQNETGSQMSAEDSQNLWIEREKPL